MDSVFGYIVDRPYPEKPEAKPRYFNGGGDEVFRQGGYSKQKQQVLTAIQEVKGEYCPIEHITEAITGRPGGYVWDSIFESVLALMRDGHIEHKPPERRGQVTINEYAYRLTARGRGAMTHAKGYKGWLKDNRYVLHGKGYAANEITKVRT